MSAKDGDIPVSVVLVTFNSASVVLGAIRSIDPGVEIVAVDNASSDGTVELLRDAGVRVIANDTNVGFGSACNIGAAATGGEFILFLNPDARLRPAALARLLQAARAQPQHAALNPRILDPDGVQSQRRMSRLLPPDLNAGLKAPLLEDQDVEMLSGAALFCRRRDFAAVGGFDEKIFLYCEDDDLAVRFRHAGRRLGYVHDAVVEHIGGASTKPTPALEQFKAYHFMKAGRYAMVKHGIRFPRRYQIVQCALKYALGVLTFNRHQQAKYRGYLAALREPSP